MEFIEIEEVALKEDYAMSSPHSHDHYELYFLFEGQRNFFIDNKMFIVSKDTLVIIPPFCMHKTEGGPYKRINVNVSPSLLTSTQNEFLIKTSKKTAFKLSNKYLKLIKALLTEGVNYPVNIKNKNEALLSIIQTIISFLSLQEHSSLTPASIAYSPTDVSTDVLKIIYYINTRFTEKITLKTLCDEFFISKVTLCKKFKDVMHCSIMEYVLKLRLNKAKELLRATNKSIEEISSTCGFSSANYFGLTFKKAIGLSPYNYKKTR